MKTICNQDQHNYLFQNTVVANTTHLVLWWNCLLSQSIALILHLIIDLFLWKILILNLILCLLVFNVTTSPRIIVRYTIENHICCIQKSNFRGYLDDFSNYEVPCYCKNESFYAKILSTFLTNRPNYLWDMFTQKYIMCFFMKSQFFPRNYWFSKWKNMFVDTK